MRARYLFHLARLCGIRPGEVGDLDLIDFAICIDSVDTWTGVELKAMSMGRW